MKSIFKLIRRLFHKKEKKFWSSDITSITWLITKKDIDFLNKAKLKGIVQ